MILAQRILNLVFVYVLCGVLLGAYGYQYLMHEHPCALCLLQRIGMIGVAIGPLMNMRFGIKMEHYAISLLSAIIGRIISLRQIALHICPEFPTFGEPILGYDLYVWAAIVFACSMFAVAVLLFLFGISRHREVPAFWHSGWEKSAWFLVGIITIANIITTVDLCGLGFCD